MKINIFICSFHIYKCRKKRPLPDYRETVAFFVYKMQNWSWTYVQNDKNGRGLKKSTLYGIARSIYQVYLNRAMMNGGAILD